jgi:hypothetical protein
MRSIRPFGLDLNQDFYCHATISPALSIRRVIAGAGGRSECSILSTKPGEVRSIVHRNLRGPPGLADARVSAARKTFTAEQLRSTMRRELRASIAA